MITCMCRKAARTARDEARRLLQAEPEAAEHLFELARAEIGSKLDTMVFWPVRYMKARTFFAFVFMGLICIWFYKLVMILFGFLMLRIVWEFGRYILGVPEAAGAGKH